MSNTPSDAEIRGLAAEGNGAYQDDETAVWEITDPSLIKFARAVLAKWGTPQPVVREPLTDEQLYEEKHNAVPQLFDLARDWADNKIHSYQFAHEAERIVNVVARRVEAAHGITQKGGSNAE